MREREREKGGKAGAPPPCYEPLCAPPAPEVSVERLELLLPPASLVFSAFSLFWPSFIRSALLSFSFRFFFSFHRISTSIVSSNVAVFLKVERADSFAVSAFSSDENRSKRLAAKVSARHTGNSNRRSEQEGGFRGRSLPLPPFLRSAIP